MMSQSLQNKWPDGALKKKLQILFWIDLIGSIILFVIASLRPDPGAKVKIPFIYL